MKRTAVKALVGSTALAVAGVVATTGTFASTPSFAVSADVTPVAHRAPAPAASPTAVSATANARLALAERASRAAARDAHRAKQLRAAKAARIAEKKRKAAKKRSALTTRPVTPGTTRALGKKMAAAHGWRGSQWAALDRLWSAESGWSTTAGNPSTGAYGIPQALPASKMASAGARWRTSARTQIAWGLDYIERRWGSPRNAYANFRAQRWY